MSIQILNKEQIKRKVERLAYQIWEDHFEEKEVVLAGIEPRGTVLAQWLRDRLEAISPLKITLMDIGLDKVKPAAEQVHFKPANTALKSKAVVLVDDVLNSGRTLAYAQAAILQHQAKKVRTLVLVNRNHKSFPVHADFIGFALSTVMEEHVDARLHLNEPAVFLS